MAFMLRLEAERRTTVLCLTLLIVMLGAGETFGQGSRGADALESFQSTLVNVIEQVEPSVVAVLRAPAPAEAEQTQVLADERRRRQFQPGELPAIQQLEKNPQGNPDPLFSLRGPAAKGAAPQVTGAGVAIADDLVLTQYLVVKSGDLHTVATTEGKQLPAEIVGADPRSSLAVLRVREGGLKPVELGKAESLRKGSFVVAVANPFAVVADGQPTASYGMVTNTAMAAPAGENLNNAKQFEPNGEESYRTTLHHLGALIQTDARLGWNASGGALVALDGNLVGLTTTVAAIAGHEQPAGYAIPINAGIRRVIATLSEGREVEYGLLGIGFDPNSKLTLPDGEPGVVVSRVYEGSAADRAGLIAGDIIEEVDQTRITSTQGLQLAIGSLPPGDQQLVVYYRAGIRHESSVRLDKIYVKGEKVVTNRPPSWQGIRVDYATAIEPNELRLASSRLLLDPKGCVVVSKVAPDSLSWRQGVRPGMFISHVSGQRVSNPEEFRNAVHNAKGRVKLRFTAGNTPSGATPVTAP